MGQICQHPEPSVTIGLPALKEGGQLSETVQLEQKSQPDTPFSHLSPAVTSRIQQINYRPHQLESINMHKIVPFGSGVFYQGPIQNSEMCGTCRVIMPDGSYYQGDTEHNQLNGQGILIDSKGSYYIGPFKNNKAEGKGMYVGEDFIYEGSFKKNLYSGHGKLTKNDSIFQGMFDKGRMKKGKLTNLIQQSIYEGDFQGNMPNGFGKLRKDGTIYEGIFKNGLIEGEGKVIDDNGDTMIVNFQKGAIINVIRLNASIQGSKSTQQACLLRSTYLRQH